MFCFRVSSETSQKRSHRRKRCLFREIERKGKIHYQLYIIKMGLLHLYCNKLTSTTNFSSCNYVQPCPCLLFGLHDNEWPSDDLPSVLTSSSEKRPQFRFCRMHYHSSFSIVLSTNTFFFRRGYCCLFGRSFSDGPSLLGTCFGTSN